MDLYDDLRVWLNEKALRENEFDHTLKELAHRMRDAGLPVARVNVGRMMLHPAIGLYDIEWEAETDLVRTSILQRSQVTPTLGDKTPFGEISRGRQTSVIGALEDPESRAAFQMFEELHARGYTGYAAFGRNFGQKQHVFEGVPEDFRGTAMSFATKRTGGFSGPEIAALADLITPIAVCLRVATERFLTVELLSHYLGRTTGEKVYSGHSALGSGTRIDCVLFYSDMRNSLSIASDMEPEAYLAVVNSYFDCTAAAVLDHGGEVLKFIGDGVLAIFPIIEGRRPRANMCRAALAAARDARERLARLNAGRTEGAPEVDFGIALHVGEVIYGNVGTAKRHDFTATGPAVGLAARIEGLSADLQIPIVATRAFADASAEPGQDLGERALKGFADPVAVIGYAARRE